VERRPSILVIDDDAAILDALEFMLEDEGYAVLTSEKADYAESLGDGARLPDLIVLDVLLSGKDGRTICRQLKSRPETRHLPVVLISAHPDADRSVREVGADAFLAKPFSVEALLDIVASLLAKDA
jgi:CheY-like chemotaxis protein